MNVPPPLYSQHPNEGPSDIQAVTSPQIIVIPTTNTLNFQNGYLGAEGERASIEGELHIKDAQPGLWNSITLSLCSVESTREHEIELGFSKTVLCELSPTASAFPSSIPFSIPLTPDTPQSLQTPSSSLSHTLTATLHPRNPQTTAPISRDIMVHTRRYSSHADTILSSPRTESISDPVVAHVEVPRSTFTTSEPIPIYVTIPPPSKEVLRSKQQKLRNIKTELVKTIRVKDTPDGSTFLNRVYQTVHGLEEMSALPAENEGPSTGRPISAILEKAAVLPDSPDFIGSSHSSVVARSGAGCRFHSTRPVKLRFVLHQGSSTLSDQSMDGNETDTRNNHMNDAECPAISQTTLFHDVSFELNIIISFLNMTNHTEHSSTIKIPLTIIPPPAPLPEVEESVGIAYQKKHDKPPSRTVRYEDTDYAPHYSEGEPGPSAVHHGAPPPFEERDAPPPFSLPTETQGSSSSHLPTFLESEEQVLFPSTTIEPPGHPLWQDIPGEGVDFGFRESDQFDGHPDGIQQSPTSLPVHELTSREGAMDDLSHDLDAQLVLPPSDQPVEEMPPPPPAMDDPSDPPPSIDSEFRSPYGSRHSRSSHSPPPAHVYEHHRPTSSPPPPRTEGIVPVTHNAPPPYAVPDRESQRPEDHVARPPPYVEL